MERHRGPKRTKRATRIVSNTVIKSGCHAMLLEECCVTTTYCGCVGFCETAFKKSQRAQWEV